MTDTWQKLDAITSRVLEKLSPVTFHVPLHGPLAAALKEEATKAGTKPETLIAEAVRAWMGETV